GPESRGQGSCLHPSHAPLLHPLRFHRDEARPRGGGDRLPGAEGDPDPPGIGGGVPKGKPRRSRRKRGGGAGRPRALSSRPAGGGRGGAGGGSNALRDRDYGEEGPRTSHEGVHGPASRKSRREGGQCPHRRPAALIPGRPGVLPTSKSRPGGAIPASDL